MYKTIYKDGNPSLFLYGDIMIYNIYKITNKLNNKVYIGQTQYDIKTRFIRHIYASHDTLLRVAIDKYGVDNFSIELLEQTEDIEKANELEEKYIKHFKSYIITYGYNSTISGKYGNNIQNNDFLSLKPIIYTDIIKNYTKVELGYLFILLLSVDINSGKIKYGNNYSQYCRNFKDLSKVLDTSYETLRKSFIKKIKENEIIKEKDNILYINPVFVSLNYSSYSNISDLFNEYIIKYELFSEYV